MYPHVKSYDELQQQRAKIDAMRRERAPKHIITAASLQLFSILITLSIAVKVAYAALNLGLMAAVIAAFLLFILWLTYARWSVHRITTNFYARGAGASILLIGYIIIYPLVAFLLYNLMTPTLATLAPYAVVASITHFVLVYVLGGITLKLQS